MREVNTLVGSFTFERLRSDPDLHTSLDEVEPETQQCSYTCRIDRVLLPVDPQLQVTFQDIPFVLYSSTRCEAFLDFKKTLMSSACRTRRCPRPQNS